MFRGCEKLKSLDLSNIKTTSSHGYMYRMFEGCKSLEYLNINGLNTNSIKDMKYVFAV